jgi:quercetin dioxygenase-like cupin family protein
VACRIDDRSHFEEVTKPKQCARLKCVAAEVFAGSALDGEGVIYRNPVLFALRELPWVPGSRICVSQRRQERDRMGRSTLRTTGRSIVATLLMGSAYQADAQPQSTLAEYSPPSRSAPLLSTFVAWDALPVRQIPQGEVRAVFDNPATGMAKIEVHITTLQPGMTLHAPHRHAWDELCLVKQGEVQVTLKDQQHRAGPGSLVFFAANDAHSIENVSNKPTTYVVINLCTPQAVATDEEPAAARRATGPLTSIVLDGASAPKTSTATGSTAHVLDSPTRTFSHLGSQIIELNSGQTTRCETSDLEHALFFVQAGQVEVTARGLSCRLGENAMAYFAPNEMMTLECLGSAPTNFQLIRFSPAPAESR